MSNNDQTIQEVKVQTAKTSEEKSSPVKQPTKDDILKSDNGEESRDSVVSSVDNGFTEEDKEGDADSQEVVNEGTPAVDAPEKKTNGHSLEEDKNKEVDDEVNGTDSKNRKRSGPNDSEADDAVQKKQRVEDVEESVKVSAAAE